MTKCKKHPESVRKITESQIQKGVLDYLAMMSKKYPIYYFRSAAGMVRTESGRIFKTGKPGVGDITICFRGIFIQWEVKTPTGRQSELQRQAQREIEASGGYYFVIRSMESAQEAFNWVILNSGTINGKPSIY